MGGKTKLFFKYWLLSSIFLCFISITLGISGAAFAQDDNADGLILEEIVVTGSRIVRNNNESASPIVTVDETLFKNSATSSIEVQLNKLPQFTPTVDLPTNGGDIQPNARNTPGEATVALRGIGSNRTLVLINGRRGTPSNALGVVDINTIPSAAIEYAEVISGGASSIYGADAMAGVLNFIMRENFEGVEIDAQMGITQEGDNFEYQVSGIIGSNIADDRGNVSVAFQYTDRDDAFQRDRDWYKELWANPSIAGTNFWSPASGFSTTGSNPPAVGVVNSVIDGATFDTFPAGISIFVDDNGNAFTGLGLREERGAPGVSGTDIIDGYQFILQDNGAMGVNFNDAYLIFPMERYNMFGNGHYEINDYVGLFAQGYFSKVSTQTIQAAAPFHAGWSVNLDPTINRDLIPPELLTILDSRPNPDDTFGLKAYVPFNRYSETDVFTFNIVAGLKGVIPGIDWTWEAFGSHGEAETTVLQTGFLSLQRGRAIMTLPNFGQGASIQGNSDFGGFGAATGTCASGINPFDWDSTTQDCWDAVTADIKVKQIMKQTIWEANTQGPIIDLPMGEVRGALGVSYRENDYQYLNDTLTTSNKSFIEQAQGLYPSGDSAGTIDVTEFYGELLIPVLSGLPFVQEFNLELGGRRSDYNTTGGSSTYKAQFDWRSTDWIRIRGGFNRAERAPNIGELFLAPEQTFAVAAGGDVCYTANLQPWSANPEANPDNWQDVVGLCGQLMEASGEPDADFIFYGVDYQDVIADPDSVTAAQTSGFAYVFPSTIGNPNLEPEKADTFTIGLVFDSPFMEYEALSNLRVSVDYYRIKIEDAIGEQSTDLVMRQCTDPAFNPAFDVNSPFCAGFDRNQTGRLGNLKRSFFNNGRFETSGIDLQINWAMDVGPGRIGVNSNVNYLISKKSAELDVLPLVEYTGTFGPTQNGLNGNSYEWRSLTEVSYTLEDLRLAVRWQHLDSIESEASATLDSGVTGAPAYDLFDLLGNYQVKDNIHLRFGIENVFNEEPPLTLINTAATDGMFGGSYDAVNNDVNGRRFYLGAKVQF